MADTVHSSLGEQLENTLQGRVCLMGVGNTDYGDDGFGVYLAQSLLDAGVQDVVIAGSSPEHWMGVTADREFDHLVFLDAVDLSAQTEPGSVIFLDSEQIAARYPQVSTHKLSLGLLAKFAESNGITKAWLLGVQPGSLKGAQTLTPAVSKTSGVLLELLFRLKTREETVC
ncbi:MAG: hydrogenase maturation protease [Terriglobales bacterium]|jgi:hydrogenase maturation protease